MLYLRKLVVSLEMVVPFARQKEGKICLVENNVHFSQEENKELLSTNSHTLLIDDSRCSATP